MIDYSIQRDSSTGGYNEKLLKLKILFPVAELQSSTFAVGWAEEMGKLLSPSAENLEKVYKSLSTFLVQQAGGLSC